MKINRKSILGLALGGALLASSSLSSAFVLIDDYDIDLTGLAIANGSSDTGYNVLQSNGNSFVIQEFSSSMGGAPVVATGDRFWDVGYLDITGSSPNGNLALTLLNADVTTNNSLYIMFQLGGTVDLSNPLDPQYIFDAGVISLVFDDDGGFASGALDPLKNRPSDGASFDGLQAGYMADLLAGVYSTPVAGSGEDSPTAPGALDGTLLELISLQFLAGAGGELPTGFGVPNSQSTGDFGVDMAATGTCVAGVFTDAGGTDLCSLANANPALSGFFLAVSGQTTGNADNLANLYASGGGAYAGVGGGFIMQELLLGDSLDLAVLPEPGTLALLGLGLLGMGALRRKRAI